MGTPGAYPGFRTNLVRVTPSGKHHWHPPHCFLPPYRSYSRRLVGWSEHGIERVSLKDSIRFLLFVGREKRPVADALPEWGRGKRMALGAEREPRLTNMPVLLQSATNTPILRSPGSIFRQSNQTSCRKTFTSLSTISKRTGWTRQRSTTTSMCDTRCTLFGTLRPFCRG